MLLLSMITMIVSGQEFTLTVSSDSVLVGNYIEVGFVLENLDGEFEAPDFENMKIVGGPNTSSSVQIINGDKSSKTTYSYYIEPLDVGMYTIPPGYVVTPEETYETLPTVINVFPNPEGIITKPASGTEDFFFQFGDISPFGRRDNKTPKPPTPPAKPKRKYKKI